MYEIQIARLLRQLALFGALAWAAGLSKAISIYKEALRVAHAPKTFAAS
jgi:hypothetical protein